jgi:ElaB/YqjD/DUF883 family membrane-anchored ribosome-binding protein
MATQTLEEAQRRVVQARQNLKTHSNKLEENVTGTIHQVVANVEDTTKSVRGLMSTTQDSVQGFLSTTSEQIEKALNISQCVRQNPLTSFSIALATGVALGVGSREAKGSLLGDLLRTVRKEITSVGETAVTQASGALKESLMEINKPGNVTGFLQNLLMPTDKRA